MRPGQNNFKNRNRNRNRRHGGGGGGGGGGGNSNNRVLDSNGPDVKLRGTAQTIAEKYMQLARDAASAGDRVMAESYYQYGDHYYRLWLAAQPPGQPIVFGRRPDDEVDEAEGAEGDDEAVAEGAAAEAPDHGDAAPAGDAPREGEGSGGEEGGGQNRNSRPRNAQDQQGNGRERFRNRWPRRNDRNYEPREGQAPDAAAESAERTSDTPERAEGGERPERGPRPDRGADRGAERGERRERFPRRERAAETEAAGEASGDWEAPSFLKRPMPAAAEDSGADAPPPERKPRARRPRYGEEGVEPNEPAAGEE